jgi:hypothetical protein
MCVGCKELSSSRSLRTNASSSSGLLSNNPTTWRSTHEGTHTHSTAVQHNAMICTYSIAQPTVGTSGGSEAVRAFGAETASKRWPHRAHQNHRARSSHRRRCRTCCVSDSLLPALPIAERCLRFASLSLELSAHCCRTAVLARKASLSLSLSLCLVVLDHTFGA